MDIYRNIYTLILYIGSESSLAPKIFSGTTERDETLELHSLGIDNFKHILTLKEELK